MSGRSKRRANGTKEEDAEPPRPARSSPPDRCWLCSRPLGARVEWHHTLPKSRGGRSTVPLHPICHRALHASFTNLELARMADAGASPAEREDLASFLRWIADKPADFHAPTRTRR